MRTAPHGILIIVPVKKRSAQRPVMDTHLTAGCRLAWPNAARLGRVPYWVFMIVMMAGAMLIYRYLTSHMRTMVDFTMTLAFLSAPLFAHLNCRAVSAANLPE